MKKHLNTLYVTTEGAYLSKQGEAVSVKVDKIVKLRIPLINLEGIVCFGNIGFSPALAGACAESGVRISFLTMYGRFQASVIGFTSGNVLLRRSQYRAADNTALSVGIVRNIITTKIANSRSVLLRGARDSINKETSAELANAAQRLIPTIRKVQESDEIDVMRGLEGTGARTYFDAFNLLLRTDKGFAMKGRTRRPPLDEVNALLSFIYSLLAHDVRGACESVGLDAAVGFLHVDRSGRPSLALDLMEELRPFLADRLALSLINRGQISLKDFTREETGAYFLTEDSRKTLLVAYQQRKNDEILHPLLGEKITLGLLPHIQAKLMARHLRGDIDAYPAFVWK
jgi:CRISP-associated protein Cas1